MVGTCLGRAAGQLVQIYVKSSVFSGAYALAGAAAMLGGVQRATISLVVIIIEGAAERQRDSSACMPSAKMCGRGQQSATKRGRETVVPVCRQPRCVLSALYVCVYICMYVCMNIVYVCVCVCVCVCVYI